MRHVIVEEPYSDMALWSRRLALFALAVAGIGVMIARGGLDTTAVFAVLGASFVVAGIALLCAAAAAVVIWRTGRKGVGILLSSALLAGLLLGYPGFLAVQAMRLPAIHDVSTDLDDPPTFSRARRALAARGDIPEDLPLDVRRRQSRAYPDVQPILLDLDADEAYQTILKAAAARGWKIIDQTPPGGRSGVGHVDAVASGMILGFPDDITIRIRPLAGQTRVDIRSASRFGRHDFGTNARRITQFADDLQDAVADK